MTKAAALIITKIRPALGDILPDGISLPAVRGLAASILRSAQRLKPMAELRAKTIHNTILSNNNHENGIWLLVSA